MKKYFSDSYGKILLGIFILILAGLTVAFADVPIVWIGGFIWGLSLVVQGVSQEKQGHTHNHNSILKELVVCINCRQKLWVPVDRNKYIDITCSTCKKSPFVKPEYSQSSTFLRNKFDLLQYVFVMALVAGGVFLLFYDYRGEMTPMDSFINNYESSTIPPKVVPKTALQEKPETTSVYASPEEVLKKSLVFDRLTNGTVLKKNLVYFQGDGTLFIDNGTDRDALAKLITSNQSIFTVYIRSRNTFTISNISNGYYDLAFSLGNNWDSNKQAFTVSQSFEKFDDSFDFTTRETDDGFYYTKFSVTLNPVFDGTARTESVGSNEFNNY
jgi:predicted nucleic-acid-binding Zn-ribbon protein